MSAKNKPHITITLDDVVRHGGVRAAIVAVANRTENTLAGKVLNPMGDRLEDYVTHTIRTGCGHYIDDFDGRMATAFEVDDDDEDAIVNSEGSYDYEWSDESVVRVECPDLEDAIQHPEAVAEMAQSVIDHHGPMSDKAAWARLIREIRAVYEAIEEIDPDDFE